MIPDMAKLWIKEIKAAEEHLRKTTPLSLRTFVTEICPNDLYTYGVCLALDRLGR